jgi:hypothetical protein
MGPLTKMNSQKRRNAAFVSLCLTVSLLGISSVLESCASKSLSKDLPPTSDAPDEYVQKFAVKESTQAVPSPIPGAQVEKTGLIVGANAPNPKPSPKAKHSRKKKKHGVSAEASPSPSPSLYVLPNRRPEKDPLWIGEKLDYEVTFWGMVAADVSIEIMPFKEIDGHKVYHIQGLAHSSKVFNLFYHIDDLAETFVDYNSLVPFRFHLVQNETKQTRDALELYDQEKLSTFYWNRYNHYQRGYLEAKEYGQLQPLSQDSVSALFYVRTQPLPTGAVITFPVASEAKGWEMVVTVVRREMLDTPMGRIQTVVIKPEAKFHGIMEKKGDSYIWLTDDDRHLMVRMEAKVRIGTVVAALKRVESLGTPP